MALVQSTLEAALTNAFLHGMSKNQPEDTIPESQTSVYDKIAKAITAYIATGVVNTDVTEDVTMGIGGSQSGEGNGVGVADGSPGEAAFVATMQEASTRAIADQTETNGANMEFLVADAWRDAMEQYLLDLVVTTSTITSVPSPSGACISANGVGVGDGHIDVTDTKDQFREDILNSFLDTRDANDQGNQTPPIASALHKLLTESKVVTETTSTYTGTAKAGTAVVPDAGTGSGNGEGSLS
jgi:hypothetical protein